MSPSWDLSVDDQYLHTCAGQTKLAKERMLTLMSALRRKLATKSQDQSLVVSLFPRTPDPERRQSMYENLKELRELLESWS
mmetsp:Transcript_21044/g.42743  ORF Transcript_21044/g.42743 Transcript_21044/m.42743 type:complete len:81 (+) Transcript_21044:102-344(+)